MSRDTVSPDLDAVNDDLYRKGSTDGHPVVPPTEERFEEMLRGTDLPPDHEIARFGNREGMLTIETLAINAIMAGCRPIHFPVVLAGARALADPMSNAIQVSVSTGSWAYFWLINGPVRNQLDIGHDVGAFGPHYQANRVIGRALGMAYKNTALIHPAEKDMGVQGNPAKFSLIVGENEEASPWEPVHVTEGYDEDQSTITFGGPNGFAQYTNRQERSPLGVLGEMIEHIPASMVGKRRESYQSWIIQALAPENAQILADAGITKGDVKEYITRNAILDGANRSLLEFITRQGDSVMGGGPDEDIPDLLRRRIDEPDLLKIPVIGGEGRENAVIGPALGGPVTKVIEFPDGWDELLEEYRFDRQTTAPGHSWIDRS